MKNITNLSLEELEIYMAERKLPKFRASQVFAWIYKNIWDFSEMTNIPQNVQEMLRADFYMGRAKIVKKQVSESDGTIKYLLGFDDGNAVECVLMEYSYGKTICISTQIGCKMGCTFCASTVGGLVRNLTFGEMQEEILAVTRDIGCRIQNVVLMGNGEPFDNYDQVIKFLRVANNPKGLGIGLRHITVSTCGVVPRIYDFADEELQVTLAISLHSSEDIVRSELMPINRKYNLGDLLEACRYYIMKTNKRVTFEYALIKDVNDTGEYASHLGRLLKGMLCHVNLIPVNEVEGKEFEKPDKNDVKRFKEILESYGIETTVRRELGNDVNAACGQLKRDFIKI